MEFYLGEELIPVLVEVRPQLVKAQDTTNDSFSCVLKANTQRDPIKPMTSFKVVYDDNSVQVFWIINDSVSVFSLNPASYKHSLTLVQYRYFLNRRLNRVTVFNQPRQKNQQLYTAVTACQRRFNDRFYYAVGSVGSLWSVTDFQVWYDDIYLNSHNKVKNIKFRYDFYSVFDEVSLELRKNDINPTTLAAGNASLRMGTSIKIVDVNNSNYVLWSSDIFDDFESETVYELTPAEVTVINNYIKNRAGQSIILRALYNVVLQPGDSQYIPPSSDPDETIIEIDECFLNTVNIEDWSVGEFNTVTLQVRIDVELFNYTMYDIIDTLLKQYRLETANLGYKRELLFNLPTVSSTGEDKELYDLLTSVYPPDTLAFTQATFYEALTEIFRFFDAGFWFDENKMLKIEYYNDLKEDISSDLKFSGLTTSQSEKEYIDKHRSFYQNAVINLKLNHMPARVDGLGVPGQNDYCLLLPKPIYEINSLSIKISGKFELWGYNDVDLGDYFYLDLTHFVVNKELWATLDKIDLGISNDWYKYNAYYQEATIPFERGSNKINLATYFNTPYGQNKMVLTKVIQHSWRRFYGIPVKYASGNWDDPAFSSFASVATEWYKQDFKVEMLALNNGLVEVPSNNRKAEGEVIENQNQGLIDLNKLGSAIMTETLRNGEPLLTISCAIDEWSNRIKEGDYFIDSDGFRWVANVINFTILPDGKQQCSIEFSKNFNLTSLRVQSDNEKRLTAISVADSVLSEETYIDYIYVGLYSEGYGISNDLLAMKKTVLLALLSQTFNKFESDDYDLSLFNVDLACITIPEVFYSDSLKINPSITASNIHYTKAQMPFIKYGSGNCICFEMQFDSPMNAGNRLDKSSGWFGSDKYFSVSTKYTDDDGWADEITINFYSMTEFGHDNRLGIYPLVCDATYLGAGLVYNNGTLDRMKFYKKPNEIFALNYEWCFLSVRLNEIFIGTKFINENSLTQLSKVKGKKYYIVYTLQGEEGQYCIMDLKGIGNHKVDITDIYVRENAVSNNIDLGFQTNIAQTTQIKTWAVVDDNNDIYFASNKSIRLYASGVQWHLTFFTRKSRL